MASLLGARSALLPTSSPTHLLLPVILLYRIPENSFLLPLHLLGTILPRILKSHLHKVTVIMINEFLSTDIIDFLFFYLKFYLNNFSSTPFSIL